MPKEVTKFVDIKEATIRVVKNGFQVQYGHNPYEPVRMNDPHVFSTWQGLVDHMFENLDAPEESEGVYD